MGKTVVRENTDNRVTGDDLSVVVGCRVTIVSGFYIGGKDCLNVWKALQNLCCDLFCFIAQAGKTATLVVITVTLREAEACQNLIYKLFTESLETCANRILQGM